MRNFRLANCIQRNENSNDKVFSITHMVVRSEIFLNLFITLKQSVITNPQIFEGNNFIEKIDSKSINHSSTLKIKLWSEKYKPTVRNALKNIYILHEVIELHALQSEIWNNSQNFQ